MSRPRPTWLYHFTHIDHVASIVRAGMFADSEVGDLLQYEAGMPSIKQQRLSAPVPADPGGMVGDYVPFYFAPRSPMMYSISCGNVPAFGSDLSPLVYLVTSVEQLEALGIPLVFTRRNAALATADFFRDTALLDTHIDWGLMGAKMWNNTDTDPDRMQRRMAECLAHRHVPWNAFEHVVAHDGETAQTLSQLLASLGVPGDVHHQRSWYY